jgi:Phytanoyl-CoA dioxygenase (PhyH)
MDARGAFEKDGFVLRRRLLSREIVARLSAIGARVHAQWLQEHAEEARKHDSINSTGLTATRYFQSPFDGERRIFFNALADSALWDLLTAVSGDDLYFHGTQMFFNPQNGRRRPYWHRDLQYMGYDETGSGRSLVNCAICTSGFRSERSGISCWCPAAMRAGTRI